MPAERLIDCGREGSVRMEATAGTPWVGLDFLPESGTPWIHWRLRPSHARELAQALLEIAGTADGEAAA